MHDYHKHEFHHFFLIDLIRSLRAVVGAVDRFLYKQIFVEMFGTVAPPPYGSIGFWFDPEYCLCGISQVLLMFMWVSSKFFDFFPPSKNMPGWWIAWDKLPLGMNERVNVCPWCPAVDSLSIRDVLPVHTQCSWDRPR